MGVEHHQRALLVPVSGGASRSVDALRRLDAEQIAVDDIGLRRPTLDDVFLSLTGHTAEAEPDAARRARTGTGADEEVSA